jgi:hypothetical protein
MCWSKLTFEGGDLSKVSTHRLAIGEPYQAATVVQPGLVAAVTRGEISWLRRWKDGFRAAGGEPISLPPVIACVPSHRTNELILICRAGTVYRAPLP